MAAKHQDWEGYKLIFELEPNLDLLTREKENLLQCAAKNPQTSEILKKLINLEYYDINYQDQYGNTALHHTHFSSNSKRCENVLILLEAGANPEIRNKTSRRQPLILFSCPEGKPCRVLKHLKKLYLLDHQCRIRCGCRREAIMINGNEEEEYQNELDEMKDITICPLPKTTLFDILQLNNDRFVRLVNNKKLRKLFTECEEDFSNKFPHYGFLLNLRVKEGAKRSKLINMGARDLAV